MNILGQAIIGLHSALYRVSGGRIGGRMFNSPVLLLNTRGRKSGRSRTSPLLYLESGDEIAIVASYGGSPSHPAWYVNLMASPVVDIQMGRETRRVKAQIATPEEKSHLWPRLVEMYPSYADYQKKTDREIPVVILHRVAE
jgi:deazaflavin-dependent oxidoreductase (nitroreductase family)